MSKNEQIISNINARLSLRPPLHEALNVIASLADELSLEKAPKEVPEAQDFLAEELQRAQSVVPKLKGFGRGFPSFTCSIATGIGKTRLMAACINYLHRAKGIRHFFILAPNLTLYNKLLRDFGEPGYEKYVFRGLAEYVTHPPRIVTGENYLSSGVGRGTEVFEKETIEINIFNIAKFNSDTKKTRKQGVTIAPRMKRLSEYLGSSYYDYLANLDDLVILMDEAHRYYADASHQAINELHPVLGLEMTATPLRDNKPVPNIVYEYNLAEALTEGLYVKIPTIAKRADFSSEGMSDDEIERIKLEDGLSVHQHTASDLELYARNHRQQHIKPFVLVACRDIAHATKVVDYLESDSFYQGRYKGKVLQIDSTTKGEDEITEQFLTLEHEDNEIEIVVHVNMLGEGWDVRNLYTIIPLRAANAHTLIEQTIGRGLRLPFGGKRTGVDNVDKLTIIAHENFARIVEEASKEDSLLKRCKFVDLDDDQLNQEGVSVLTVPPTVSDPLLKYRKQAEQAKSEEGKMKALELYNATEAVQEAVIEVAEETETASIVDIAKDPEKLKLLRKKVYDRIDKSNSLFGEEIKSEITDDFVVETITQYKRNLIEIPRISILPREVRYELAPFTVDFSNAKFVFSVKDAIIVRQDLVDHKQEILEVIASGRDQSVKKKILLALMDEPDIDYNVMREEILDLINQILNYIGSYIPDPQDAIRTIDQNVQLIAKRLHDQIQNHLITEVEEYDETKVLPFSKIEPINLGERASYPRKTLHDHISKLSEIKRYIFQGFQKACHECYSFDSNTERNFAIVLENDRDVLTWLRPALYQFNINWGRDNRRYQPDFVVETEKKIYIVETKAEKDLSAEDVKAKAEAASRYCKLATNYTSSHGGKEWEYLLISHLSVETTFSFSHIRQLSKVL